MAGAQSQFGALETLIFLLALIFGTVCSLTSKIMLSMKSIGMTGEIEDFSFPLFQVLGMFLGMVSALPLHALVLRFRIPFPGYVHENPSPARSGVYTQINSSIQDSSHNAIKGDEKSSSSSNKQHPLWLYFVLVVPAIFDLLASALCMFGLRYVDVSIYQMLRGSSIVFVALLKQFVMKDRLRKFQWLGVFWNVVSIFLIGATAIGGGEEEADSAAASSGEQVIVNSATRTITGILLILAGALVQSLQYAFEERIMSLEDEDGNEQAMNAPPLLLIGMEGFWGTIICVAVLYPLAYFTPGPDHGSIENPFNTLAMIRNSTSVQFIFTIYFFSILIFNILAVLVTFTLSALHHCILDNFRPITVWATDLIIYYYVTTSLGEQWTSYSWLQILGCAVLIYGTAIYNAPGAGGLRLTGKCTLIDCGFDFSQEYSEVEEKAHAEGDAVPKSQLSTMSPFLSPRSRQNRENRLNEENSYGAVVDGGKRQRASSINV